MVKIERNNQGLDYLSQIDTEEDLEDDKDEDLLRTHLLQIIVVAK